MINSLFRTVSVLTASESLVFNDFQTGQPISFKVSAIDSIVGRRKDPKSLFWKGDQCFIWQSGSRFHVRSSRSEVLTEISNLAAIVTSVDVPYVKIEDQKTDGANGGTFSSGARRTRDINTVVTDSQNIIVSLSGNQLELPAGIYLTHIRAAAYRVDSHILFLENVTDTTTLLQSGSAMSRENPAASQVFAEIFDRFTIAAGKKLEVQHECAQDRATDGFGTAATAITGVPEIYLQWELRKIA